ncbi:MAG: replication protein RepA [Rhodospirillaceae bacterium]
MADIHEIVLLHGAERARQLVSKGKEHLVDIVARLLSEESEELGFSYSGFCLAAFPHRKQADDKPWKLETPRVTLLVEPGFEVRPGKEPKPVGVPYGSRSRLIMLYLQTQAVKQQSREVVLGKSMSSWMDRMGVSNGGKSYLDVREQTKRLSRCSISFHWQDAGGAEGIAKTSIIEAGLFFSGRRSDHDQGTLWEDTVTLSEQFYRSLVKHPVPIWEPALMALSNKSMALDAYVWLAYRLHSLKKAAPVSWPLLHQQFGAGFAALKHFQPEFKKSLEFALAVYENARVEIDATGIVLYPSPPPIPERIVPRLTR